MTKIWNRRREAAAREWDIGHADLIKDVEGLREVARRMVGLSEEIDSQAPDMRTYKSRQAVLGLRLTYTYDVAGIASVLKQGAEMVGAADRGEPVMGYLDGKMNAVIDPIRARELAGYFEQSKYRRLMGETLGRPKGFMAGHGYLDAEVLRTYPGQSRQEQAFLRDLSAAFNLLDDRRIQLNDGREPTARRSGTFVSLNSGREYVREIVAFYERGAELMEVFELSCRAVVRGEEPLDLRPTPDLAEEIQRSARELGIPSSQIAREIRQDRPDTGGISFL